MNDLGPLKFIVIAGVLLTMVLTGVGMLANSQGERMREDARRIRRERREMFDAAIENARHAQQVARMRTEAQLAEIERAEYGSVTSGGWEDDYDYYDDGR